MQGFFAVTAPADRNLAKQNVLCGASRHFKIQVPLWTPFCCIKLTLVVSSYDPVAEQERRPIPLNGLIKKKQTSNN